MYTRRWLLITILGVRLLPGQEVSATFEVSGAGKQPHPTNMPRGTVTATNNGMETVYDGVRLHEILKKAAVPQGSELRGKALTDYVPASLRELTKLEVVQVRK
jgi:hypothetical protein